MSRPSSFLDEDLTSTFPSNLAELSLADDNLVDQDFGDVSNVMDASFEFVDSQPSAASSSQASSGASSSSGVSAASAHTYLGSMAQVAEQQPHPSSSSQGALNGEASGQQEWTPVGLQEDDDDEELVGASEDEVKRYNQLKQERDGMRSINRMLAQVAQGFSSIEGDVERVDDTIATTHALLDFYSKLSSQAEHTQQLMFSPQWEGATKDFQLLAAREAEEQKRLQEEQARLVREEAERQAARERAAAKAEEDARKRALAETKKAPIRGSTRGRGLSSSSAVRGSALSSTTSRVPRASTVNGSFGSASAPASATTSGIGRGGPPVRGTVTGVRGVRGLKPRGISRGASSAAGGAAPK